MSEFLHEQQRALKEKQVAAVIAHLQTTNVTELVHTVKSEVGSGLHLTHFSERKQFWERCVGDVVLDEFVAALRLEYARLLGECLVRTYVLLLFDRPDLRTPQQRTRSINCVLLHRMSER